MSDNGLTGPILFFVAAIIALFLLMPGPNTTIAQNIIVNHNARSYLDDLNMIYTVECDNQFDSVLWSGVVCTANKSEPLRAFKIICEADVKMDVIGCKSLKY